MEALIHRMSAQCAHYSGSSIATPLGEMNPGEVNLGMSVMAVHGISIPVALFSAFFTVFFTLLAILPHPSLARSFAITTQLYS